MECWVLRIMRDLFKKYSALVVYLIEQRALNTAHVEIDCAIRIQPENWISIYSTRYRSQTVWSRRAHLTDLDTGKLRSKDCITQPKTRRKGAERRKIPQVRSTRVYWTDFWKIRGVANHKKHRGGQKKDVQSTTYTLTTTEYLLHASHWKIQLNSSGPNGPMAKRSDYQETVRLKARKSASIQENKVEQILTTSSQRHVKTVLVWTREQDGSIMLHLPHLISWKHSDKWWDSHKWDSWSEQSFQDSHIFMCLSQVSFTVDNDPLYRTEGVDRTLHLAHKHCMAQGVTGAFAQDLHFHPHVIHVSWCLFLDVSWAFSVFPSPSLLTPSSFLPTPTTSTPLDEYTSTISRNEDCGRVAAITPLTKARVSFLRFSLDLHRGQYGLTSSLALMLSDVWSALTLSAVRCASLQQSLFDLLQSQSAIAAESYQRNQAQWKILKRLSMKAPCGFFKVPPSPSQRSTSAYQLLSSTLTFTDVLIGIDLVRGKVVTFWNNHFFTFLKVSRGSGGIAAESFQRNQAQCKILQAF